MLDLGYIVRKNRESFYDFGTKKHISQCPRVITTLAFSLGLAVASPSIPEKLVSSVLASQSILVGFSFNVLFYLMANRNIGIVNDDDSFEEQILNEESTTLSKELFFNISYFNLVTLIGIMFSVVLMVFPLSFPGYLRQYSITLLGFMNNITHSHLSGLCEAAQTLSVAVYFFLLGESAFTFLRVIERTTILFKRAYQR